MKPRVSDKQDNLYVVSRKENFIHWLAWRYWLAREAARTFFPDVMTVPGEWPPQTLEQASAVREQYVTWQKNKKLPIRFSDPPEPWDRWGITETLDLERRHREDLDWLPPLPKSRIGDFQAKPVRTELDDWISEKASRLPHICPGESVADYRTHIAAMLIEKTAENLTA